MAVSSSDRNRRPAAVIYGCAGPRLTTEEKRLFADADPLGFILFGRNVSDPDQVRALVAEMRETVGRADAPVLIDQEGGRVARLRPPHWRAAPPPAIISRLATRDIDAAREASFLNARLLAAELDALGITVDCAPVLDLPQPDADPIIGDRAAGPTVELAVEMGAAACEGFLAGGVSPVIKHIPGHGRALVDSHKALPVVDATREALREFDFAPFVALSRGPLDTALWAMTAHVVYTEFDDHAPCSTSKTVIEQVVRAEIGFAGVLVSDDLSMEALSGTQAERAAAVLAAGCDAALHCSGRFEEMAAVAEAVRPMDEAGWKRVLAAEEHRATAREKDLDVAATTARLTHLLAALA